MIKIRNLTKTFDDEYIFKDFDLDISEDKITTILGPSGSGKTTLFKILSGLLPFEHGGIEGIDNQKLSFIFQEPRLLRWKTVEENIAFVLKDIYTQEEIDEIISRELTLVDLLKDRNKYPKQLSGGMKQRVAIARAFAYPSDILLMDEGLSGLDLSLKLGLIRDFINIWEDNKKTVIFITHDVEEAILLSDEIIQFSDKPVNIINRLTIDVPRDQRLNSTEIDRLKRQLLKNY
jgi:NitT/TauT family transport system ATP-binding protein